LELDLRKCVEEMKKYVEGEHSPPPVSFETTFTVDNIHISCFHDLKPEDSEARFLSVDASSYLLMKANNWRIGVSRCAYVLVEKINGKWVISEEGCIDHIFPTIAPVNQRKFLIWAKLREYESSLALSLLEKLEPEDFCLVDGAAFFGFGSKGKYSIDLYNECFKRGIRLLMVSKNSPGLYSKKRQDLLATLNMYGTLLQKDGKLGKCWIYHPIQRARIDCEDLYGDVTCVKLSPSSSRVFRCDVAEYIVKKGKDYMLKTVSELSNLSMDARCNGYPAPLFLAHERTRIPKAKLLEYHELVQKTLAKEGLLDFLLLEVDVASFRRHLLGLTFDFELLEDFEV